VTWGQAIVDSFRQAASAAGGQGIAPSDVFAAGVQLAAKVMPQMSIWSPASSVGLIIAGLVIEICFALIAAAMVLALVESYLIICRRHHSAGLACPDRHVSVADDWPDPRSCAMLRRRGVLLDCRSVGARHPQAGRRPNSLPCSPSWRRLDQCSTGVPSLGLPSDQAVQMLVDRHCQPPHHHLLGPQRKPWLHRRLLPLRPQGRSRWPCGNR
jgi:TrbL/VirB6 plasmid conjugal transfer protein